MLEFSKYSCAIKESNVEVLAQILCRCSLGGQMLQVGGHS